MKKFLIAAATMALLAAAGSAAEAQPRRDNDRYQQTQQNQQNQQNYRDNDRRDNRANGYRHHREWRKGYRMSRNDWNRGRRIDYRARRLNAPPRGYEYREVDGNVILGAIATGVIFSILANQ